MRLNFIFGLLFMTLTSFGQVGVQLPAFDAEVPVWSAIFNPSVVTENVKKSGVPSLESMFTSNQNLCTYSYEHLAFFCKIEVDIEKAIKIPVKIRLGSVDYVDYLEGKR